MCVCVIFLPSPYDDGTRSPNDSRLWGQCRCDFWGVLRGGGYLQNSKNPSLICQVCHFISGQSLMSMSIVQPSALSGGFVHSSWIFSGLLFSRPGVLSFRRNSSPFFEIMPQKLIQLKFFFRGFISFAPSGVARSI